MIESRNLYGKELEVYKKNLKLTSEQREILVGTLLGDATIPKMSGEQTFNVKFEQKIGQQEYVNHLYDKFKNFVGTPPKIRDIGGNAKSCWFITYRHPAFRFYEHQFYTTNASGNRRKIVPDLIHRWLTPRVLAYWYMDDGSVSTCGHNYTLNTQAFTYKEQVLLVEALKRNFGFEVNIWKDHGSYRLGVLANSRNDFTKVVLPHVFTK